MALSRIRRLSSSLSFFSPPPSKFRTEDILVKDIKKLKLTYKKKKKREREGRNDIPYPPRPPPPYAKSARMRSPHPSTPFLFHRPPETRWYLSPRMVSCQCLSHVLAEKVLWSDVEVSKNPRRVEGTVSWSGMDKVGGKGNEKTTSAGQRVCERVRVFWSPHRPPLLSSPPREGEGLPRGCLALSLDLRVGTAPGFKGGSKGGRPLLPLPHIPHHTPKPPLPRRWDPSPSRAPGPVARPLPWHPHPRPQPRLQMAAPSARLAAPRRRPAAAAGRSLPPSCCGDHDCSARRAGSCAGSAWGRSRAAEGRARAVPAGKEPTRPQVRSARG